ncbi:hypothetical protein ACFL35_13850 [Candidatus Riflebacteria bacterium]
MDYIPVFVYSGRGVASGTRKITYFNQGALSLVYKGGSDNPPIFRIVRRSGEISFQNQVFPDSTKLFHLRRFGKWMYVVKGRVFTDNLVAYSIFTAGDFQHVYMGYSTGSGEPAFTIITKNERVFIVRGNSQSTGAVRSTITSSFDRDFLQNGYQTGSAAVLYTLEKKIGLFYIYGGMNTDPKATLLTISPHRLDAANGLGFILSGGGTYFSQSLAIPFLLSISPYWELRRETLIVIYLLEDPSSGGGCGSL